MSAFVDILLLDDHPLILDGLAGFLEGQESLDPAGSGRVRVVGRCATAASALAAVKSRELDAAILDIKVGGEFTFGLMAEALRLRPGLKVVCITGFDDDALIERAFQSGALGFALKSDPPDELLAALRSVLAGRRYLSPTLLARFPQLARDQGAPVVTTRLARLTPREREVLALVSAGKSAKEISRLLNISAWTVTNHKANIMAKLDIHNQVGLTRFAVSTGLVTL